MAVMSPKNEALRYIAKVSFFKGVQLFGMVPIAFVQVLESSVPKISLFGDV